ncbi:MAG: TAXI family TRAP transporter solute-binding subunit [Methyloceanibacter sp.]
MRIALACGFCLIFGAAVAAPSVTDRAHAEANTATQSTRESFRSRMNENVVTIMAGSPSGTDLAVIQDLADVLDDGDNLRVLPIVGKGPEQNIKDVMFLRGVDMGITQANLLKHFDRTGELGPNLKERIAYIAKLFNEEMHVLVRSEVSDIKELNGKPVNFGAPGSGTEITGRLIFAALGVDAQEVNLGDADAIEKLKSGEIAATILVTGKPAPAFTNLKDAAGLKLLPVPYAKTLEDEYYPATLTHDDYPALVPEGTRVDTLSVCAVLVSFNWPSDSIRYKKIGKFVERFFTEFDDFLAAPRQPKWRDVNFAATLEGWHRSPLAQAWIDQAASKPTSSASRSNFDAFLAEASTARGAPISDAERADLFRAFLEWNKGRKQN